MNACGKFNWIFDVFKLRRSEREILAPASRVASGMRNAACGMWHSQSALIPARQLVMLQSKLIFNALAMCHSAFLFIWQAAESARAWHASRSCMPSTSSSLLSLSLSAPLPLSRSTACCICSCRWPLCFVTRATPTAAACTTINHNLV